MCEYGECPLPAPFLIHLPSGGDQSLGLMRYKSSSDTRYLSESLSSRLIPPHLYGTSTTNTMSEHRQHRDRTRRKNRQETTDYDTEAAGSGHAQVARRFVSDQTAGSSSAGSSRPRRPKANSSDPPSDRHAQDYESALDHIRRTRVPGREEATSATDPSWPSAQDSETRLITDRAKRRAPDDDQDNSYDADSTSTRRDEIATARQHRRARLSQGGGTGRDWATTDDMTGDTLEIISLLEDIHTSKRRMFEAAPPPNLESDDDTAHEEVSERLRDLEIKD